MKEGDVLDHNLGYFAQRSTLATCAVLCWIICGSQQ